jgi:hypothetical protein
MSSRAPTILIMATRLVWVAALVFGVAWWWMGTFAMLHAHWTFGGLTVLGLWALAILALKRARTLAVLTLAWGAALPVLGMAQLHVVLPALPWTFQVIHVLMVLAAMGLAEALAKRLKSPAVQG